MNGLILGGICRFEGKVEDEGSAIAGLQHNVRYLAINIAATQKRALKSSILVESPLRQENDLYRVVGILKHLRELVLSEDWQAQQVG
ncbi:hypothetical protein [Coleofasciculus sp. G2-EDA-02]|uniref:hypothetical protein n=1 Tax=Coleofasciculus sp. G2-EDA-02 TaxID=3069529 RepID=UPI0032F6AAED